MKNNSIFETESRDGRRILTAYRGHQKTVVIPDGVEIIDRYVFRRCLFLEELVLPTSLKIIEAEAFNGCYSLKRIRFAEGLLQIRHRGFWCCSALTEVTFPRSLLSIGSRSFECCSMLRTVRFLNEAVQIDEYAFNETPYFEKKLREAAVIMEQSRKKSKNGLHYYNDHGDASVKTENFSELNLPEGVTHIDHWAYCNSIIKKLTLPNSLRTLGMCAFKDSKELVSVSMSPNTYCNYRLKLGPSDGIFAGCSSLEEVTLRGPLKDFKWYDADAPEILHGFDRERTFLHCPSLQRLIAWQIPLVQIPAAWRQLALNGFIADPEREGHYLPGIAAEYHRALKSFREQMIRRTATSPSFALHQYLTDHDMIYADEIDTLIDQASGSKDPEVIAMLLSYKRRKFTADSFANGLLAAADEL